MFDYAAMQNTASGLIAKFGADAVITRTSGATFDPATGGYTGGATTTLTGKAVRMRFTKNEIDGELVQRGDFRLLVDAASGEPLIGDTATFDGVAYRVMDVITTAPANTSVMYDVQCRR